MTVPSFTFDLITQDGRAYSGNVESLVVPGEKGSFGVLANHAAFVSSCVPGKLKVTEENGNEVLFQMGKGFFEVVKNKAVLLTNVAEKTT